MSILAFPFPKSPKKPLVFMLRRVDKRERLEACPEGSNYILARSPILLRKGDISTYRAVLRHDERLVAHVVCKLAHGEENLLRLRKEAEFYNGPLKSLQGAIVPLFFGLFEGKMEGKLYGCLVTDYIGKHSEVPFYGLPWETKYVRASYHDPLS